MSEDITFTFNNASVFGQIIFVGATTQTCSYTINGGGLQTNVPMVNFFLNIGAGSQALRIFNVSAAGITSFTFSTNLIDNLTSVTTGNNSTWGFGTGSLTSLATTFQNAINLTSVPTGIPASIVNLSNTFNGCVLFNQSLNGWNTENVTTMASMFNGCTLFNNAGLALWNNSGSTVAVTNMSGMFFGCGAFNADISAWSTSNVTDMSTMFLGCTIFNRDIGNWNTNKLTTISNMFNNAIAFNANISYWSINASVIRSNIIFGATAFENTYGPTSTYTGPGYFYPDLSVAFFNQPRPERYPCFMKGTQILCLRAEEEVYRPVQDLRKGDLVKTYRNGYLPIHMIGTSRLSNPGDEERTTNRLYKCSKDLYPGLFEDLYITGCHSILVPALTDDQWENTKAMLGNVYITDHHFRLMACVDEKAQPFKRDAMIDIYHIALENEDYYMNYGIYANGLLVESCSKRYLTELSNMRIIGEDEACYDAPSVNVFSELGSFVQTF